MSSITGSYRFPDCAQKRGRGLTLDRSKEAGGLGWLWTGRGSQMNLLLRGSGEHTPARCATPFGKADFGSFRIRQLSKLTRSALSILRALSPQRRGFFRRPHQHHDRPGPQTLRRLPIGPARCHRARHRYRASFLYARRVADARRNPTRPGNESAGRTRGEIG